MTPRLKFNLFALFFILLISCKGDKKEVPRSDSSKMKEVLAIHDEVMPKMGRLGKLISELKTKEDSTEIGLRYKEAREDLQAAHKSMMEWMQGFGKKFGPEEIQDGKELTVEKQKLLDAEEAKIKGVRDAINSSLEKAEDLLKQD